MDSFGAHLGYKLIPATEPDRLPTAIMTIEEKHLSSVGVAHGGAVYSLVDFAFGGSVWVTELGPDEALSTINIDIHYLRPVPLGSQLTVHPVMLHRGRTIVRMEGKVLDDRERLVAFATGSFNLYRRKGRFERAIGYIDELHLEDPDDEELLYAERMTERLGRLAPDAPDTLKLAARAQHLCRWRIARTEYPEGKAGYKRWRKDEQKMHARLAGECLTKARYDQETIERVQFLVQKKKLKVDEHTQLLEDVICLVFLEHYLEAFAGKHAEDKLVDIVRKTWKKMSERGHEAALALNLAPKSSAVVQKALSL